MKNLGNLFLVFSLVLLPTTLVKAEDLYSDDIPDPNAVELQGQVEPTTGSGQTGGSAEEDDPAQGVNIQIQTQDKEDPDRPVSSDGARPATPAPDVMEGEDSVRVEPDTGVAPSEQAEDIPAELTYDVRGEGGPSPVAEERRSRVANAVQEILQVADRSEGIGQEVSVIAGEQLEYQERAQESLDKAQQRGGVARFFLGPDYRALKQAQANLDFFHNNLEELQGVKEGLTDPEDREVVQAQIDELEDLRDELLQEVAEAEQGFSLLGWLFRLFS